MKTLQQKIVDTDFVIWEAERFIRKAKAFKKHMKTMDSLYYWGGKEQAAARRASLDLTRALAEWRKV